MSLILLLLRYRCVRFCSADTPLGVSNKLSYKYLHRHTIKVC